jgi:hypothetical protein
MRGSLRIIAAATVAALTALAGCSGNDGPSGPDGSPSSAQATIGPAGGTCEIAGEAALSVPPGALAAIVDFEIQEELSPAPPPVPMNLVSSAYSFEPTGTTFAVDATVTVNYDDTGLGRPDESSVRLYTNDGSGWEELATTLDTQANEASAAVGHLSDFAAMVDTTTSGPAVGIFAALKVSRTIMTIPTRRDTIVRTDFISAWFDSMYAPCSPVSPIRADSVMCNEYALWWSEPEGWHEYIDPWEPAFIVLGESYEFNVDNFGRVPALSEDVDFPEREPHLVSPEPFGTVHLSGFTIQWADAGGERDIHIAIIPGGMGDEVVAIETANDGSHTFSANDLSGLSPGLIAVALNYFERHTIDAAGYDSRSVIEAKVTNSTLLTLMP